MNFWSLSLALSRAPNQKCGSMDVCSFGWVRFVGGGNGGGIPDLVYNLYKCNLYYFLEHPLSPSLHSVYICILADQLFHWIALIHTPTTTARHLLWASALISDCVYNVHNETQCTAPRNTCSSIGASLTFTLSLSYTLHILLPLLPPTYILYNS